MSANVTHVTTLGVVSRQQQMSQPIKDKRQIKTDSRQSAYYIIVIYPSCYVFFIIIMELLFILMQAMI